MRAFLPPKLLPMVLMMAALTSASAAPRLSQAETLDDQSIRALYASIETDIMDKSKMRQQLENRLAANYAMKLNRSTVASGMPPHNSTVTLNRQDTIANVLKGYDSMSIESCKFDIFDIAYSPDRKIAYVKQTVTTSGSMVTPGIAQNAPPMTRYRDVEKCQEAVALIGGRISFLQTACDSQVMIGQKL